MANESYTKMKEGDGGGLSLGTIRNVVLFTAAMIGLYVAVGFYVARITGNSGGAPQVVAQGVNPDAGEQIFFGKGKCSTCHSVGDHGSAVRCPNLADIGVRMDERAKEQKLPAGTDYLVQSLHEPSAYVVKGYSGNTMPKVYLPPISLSGEEIQAVITFLQSQGGTVNAGAIHLPPDMVAGAAAGGAVPEAWKPYLTGDPAKGEALFRKGRPGMPACAACHTVAGEGAKVGPDLTDVAATRGPEYILKSILDPNAEVVVGYKPNVMPPIFANVLTVHEIHDILAFLMKASGLPVAEGMVGTNPSAAPATTGVTETAGVTSTVTTTTTGSVTGTGATTATGNAKGGSNP